MWSIDVELFNYLDCALYHVLPNFILCALVLHIEPKFKKTCVNELQNKVY